MQKIIIYQVFTRLFGNNHQASVSYGDLRTNGVGKMADFTTKALAEIRQLGATHIWYTGVIEHATQTDYSAHGIATDHPAVVKGKAGSPYAIKDYYDIDPDLARKPEDRMQEFHSLVRRTHQAGLKLIIDFVPNHVARQYHSDSCPDGVEDLGANDNVHYAFSPQNNFYYIPEEELHAQFDLKGYKEYPAKATGNDNFSAWPGQNDWYETIKLNYGVDYIGGRQCHFDPVPNTWMKMRDILLFWAGKGIDGFRCDMAEMVPVEFWEWVIPQVKELYPELIFIAEVYNPSLYRAYIHQGHFDYLYDKVGLYDTLRNVTCKWAPASMITQCWQQVDDIRHHMLNFLENHDEQRLASDFFASDPIRGRAPLLVSTLMGDNPMMIYFGQELGERSMDEEGFSGKDGRTTIFDYWTVDSIRRWRNKNKFDGSLLSTEEKALRSYYQRILSLANEEKALARGDFYDLMYANPSSSTFDQSHQYAFLRHHAGSLILVIANFADEARDVEVHIPMHVFELYGIAPKIKQVARELISGETYTTDIHPEHPIRILVPALGGIVLKLA